MFYLMWLEKRTSLSLNYQFALIQKKIMTDYVIQMSERKEIEGVSEGLCVLYDF